MSGALLAGACSGAATWAGSACGGRGGSRLRRLSGSDPQRPRGPWLRRGSRWARTQGTVERTDGVVEMLAAFASELRAGAAPTVSFERAVAEVGHVGLARELGQVAEMVRLGASGPSALRAVGTGSTGSATPELVWLAAAWELADERGAALAPTVARVAATARAEHRHRASVRAEMAGPRASARMLAALPAVGLGLAVAVGADPVRVLVSTPGGGACLLAAGALEYAGLRWTRTLVRRAEEAA